MSRLAKFLAGAALIFSIVTFMPGSADARWRGGHWHGGWGWGPGIGLGLGLGYGWGYPYAYYPGPYYYAAPYYAAPACGWVRVRAWRDGHRVYRRVWRCW